MSRDQGFTLVEMLVTMVLLSMIVLIGSSAYGIFAQRWDGQLGKFDVAMQNTRDLMLVQEVLDSLMPYVVYREDETPVVYFEGNRNGFVAVSSRSVFSGQVPAVVRFSVVQNEDLRFDVRYEEWAMDDDVLRMATQSIDFSEPLTLFRDIENPIFGYLGWSSSEERFGVEGVAIAKAPQWLSSYDAVKLPFAPLKARLSFKFEDFPYQISSALTASRAGLLSSYSGSRRRLRNDAGDPVEPLGECFC